MISIKLKDYKPKDYKPVEDKKILIISKTSGLLNQKRSLLSYDVNMCNATNWEIPNSFIDCLYHCYSLHQCLSLSPDIMWLLISQGIAYFEDMTGFLGKKYDLPKEKQKKTLKIIVEQFDETKKEGWNKNLKKFVPEIKKNVPEDLFALVHKKFSTTDCLAQTCHAITLMSTMKKYFAYKLIMMCYIPEIRITGKREDWEDILNTCKKIAIDWKDEMGWWINGIVGIMKHFVDAYDGKIDKIFWDSLFNLESSRIGSGSNTEKKISGWSMAFFPKESKDNINWDDLAKGIIKKGTVYCDAEDLKPAVCNAPMVLVFLNGKELDCILHAGLFGIKQNKDKSLSPSMGWSVSVEK